MYIGGTDEKALHHLFAEVIDNAMDEAVAGHADLHRGRARGDGFLTVTDNGRGIPVDPHPKFPKKSALEVIMTTLHAGGKFGKVYETCGGLHGVGVSVVNALSERSRSRSRAAGSSTGRASRAASRRASSRGSGRVQNRRGTKVRFQPDPQIFGKGARFKPARLFRMARSKAYLFGGVEIRWRCAPALLAGDDNVPAEASFHFPGGLKDYLARDRRKRARRRPSSPARSTSRAATARSNGRSPGWRPSDGFSPPTATPSRRPRAARTRAACASRCCAACASMPSASANKRMAARSPPTT